MLCHENIIGLQLDHSCDYEIATRCGTSAWMKLASLVILNFVVQCTYGLTCKQSGEYDVTWTQLLLSI